MPSFLGWDGFLYEKNYIPKKENEEKEAGFSNLPFCMSLWAHRDVVRQWEWGGSRLKSPKNTLMKADLHVNNLQQLFSFPKCVNFPPYPSAQFFRCYEDWCYQPPPGWEDNRFFSLWLSDYSETGFSVNNTGMFTWSQVSYRILSQNRTNHSLLLYLSFKVWADGFRTGNCKGIVEYMEICSTCWHRNRQHMLKQQHPTENYFLMHIFCVM